MNSQDLQNNKKYTKDYNFFKKVWYSITKFENYPEMSALGVPKAILYLAELMIIFSIALTIILFIYINNTFGDDTDDLSYFEKFQSALNVSLDDTQKQELEHTFSMYDIKTLNVIFVIASFISIFISYFIVTLVDILMLSLFGLLTCFITKIKMKYRAIFNMSTYAITISIILRLVYEGLLLLANFKIKYFDVMYTSIAYICLAAAIFMIRTDLIKQQIELMKVIEEKKKRAYEEEKEKKNEEDKQEKQEKKEKENKDENEQKEDVGNGEEQGSNA